MQVATGALRDGKVLIGSETAPLAVAAPRGRGQIIVLTFAPELEPFRVLEERAVLLGQDDRPCRPSF